jgi:hypothetical protein
MISAFLGICPTFFFEYIHDYSFDFSFLMCYNTSAF